MPIVGYARTIGASVDQTEAVIAELSAMQICERTEEANGNVTLQNRRMVRYETDRKQASYRAKMWRERQTNAKVTPLSSSSSSLSTSKHKPPDSATQNLPPLALELAGILRDGIMANNAQARITEADVGNWAREADLMLRRDARPEADLREAIVWSQADPFWRQNIRSMGKLRKHFDRFLLARKELDGKREGHFGEGSSGDRYRKDRERDERQLAKLEAEAGNRE